MEKRVVSKRHYEFLEHELDIHKQNNIIDEEQCSNILDSYLIKKRISFVSVLLIVGSILIGLGILSFVAANWYKISKLLRILNLFVFLLGSGFASYKLSDKFPKTSRSLLYLTGIIYGAGIFLIGQIFNFGGHFTTAFLLWGVGILPLAVLFKDKLIFLFANILFLVYINGYFDLENSIPWFMLLIIPSVYYLNYKFFDSKLITFFNNIIVLSSIYLLGEKANMDENLVVLFFVLGIIMYIMPVKYHSNIQKIQGSIVFGIAGFIMTFKDFWSGYIDFADATYLSIVFSVVFILLLLLFIKRGNITSLVFICLTILKFYFDITFDFMPKSLFFILGGVLLVSLGIFFEKSRRKLGGIDYEHEKEI